MSKDRSYQGESSLVLFSPAKLNLFFKILKKREDGYHEISSLYQAISLGDHITITPSSENSLSCNDPLVPVGESNLVWKAYKAFQSKTCLSTPVTITIKKNIPIQAGLGGGSSNAATALFGLNKLHGNPLSQQELIELGATLGSDVSFFFSSGTALCTGRGEKIKSLAPIKLDSLWVAKPNFGMSTPAVYKNVKVEEDLFFNPQELIQEIHEGKNLFFNDLEKAAFPLNSELQKFKEKLLCLGFHTVIMSGSGSSFFCLGSPSSSERQEFFLQRVETISRQEDCWYEF